MTDDVLENIKNRLKKNKVVWVEIGEEKTGMSYLALFLIKNEIKIGFISDKDKVTKNVQ